MLQAEPRGTLPYSGFIDCLQKINAEGGVSLLYRGGAVLAVRGAFFTAGQMLGYDVTKSEAKAAGVTDGPVLHIGASVSAAFMATTFSMPADVLLARYSVGSQRGEFTSPLQCAAVLLKTEGPGTFFRGWGLGFTRLIPVMLIAMPAMEQLRWAFGLGYLS
mmetsp:Transcript_19949/g.52228  ORF Transcript_19949/g.52228 Transcript_19949/m.52228 type:complete len:161 (-) Transcript_19949:29-511(-)